MSSPLSTDFGLPVSSLGSGARVRVPNDDRPYLTSWREQTQERRGPEDVLVPHFADPAGDCHLLASAI